MFYIQYNTIGSKNDTVFTKCCVSNKGGITKNVI